MRAVIVRRFGGPEVLEIADLPSPEPGPGQVRIRVAAAAVNRIDLSTRSGALTEAGLLPPGLPEVALGWDVAGQVDAIGAGVTRYRVGDRVIGLRDVLSAGGTQADQVVLDATAVAAAPTSVPVELAAAVPLIGLTADRSLSLTGLHAGQTLLVTGAAGGVGGLLLQLAALRGIRTVAVADGSDEPYVRGLGADEFVARTDRLGAAVRRIVPGGVDAVVDAAVIGVAAPGGRPGGVRRRRPAGRTRRRCRRRPTDPAGRRDAAAGAGGRGARPARRGPAARPTRPAARLNPPRAEPPHG
jgi:NADPH:quinone reductase-like Zn-dependent oxidoreductase